MVSLIFSCRKEYTSSERTSCSEKCTEDKSNKNEEHREIVQTHDYKR